ncbi:terpenoid cyclases/protein prenyltransferase alpha-alpha toroid [Phakopsora pachyrhizi]|nr:terpenoid cyclases/protein prenyltransferase alpha-alpha toroid [Phakopsora pachyrhizi]
MVVLDLSRSWLSYWIIGSLSFLGVDLSLDERKRAIDTIISFQNSSGGFGGGPGYLSHLAGTYACISTLAILTSGLTDDLIHQTWSRVDRRGMYDWMLSLKRSDGSFQVQLNGEIDHRASYAVIAIGTFLNILTPELIDSLPEFINSTQDYEGGLASKPTFDRSESHHPGIPLGESHGAYASCGLATYFMINDLPSTSSSAFDLDLQACLRWAAGLQTLPIDGGGFKGRTNKLVDGCYSWWSGALFPVLDALISSENSKNLTKGEKLPDLFNRRALQEYILLISQVHESPNVIEQGGMRDKPGMDPDVYHSFYVLSGLSLSQHRHLFDQDSILKTFKPINDSQKASLSPEAKNSFNTHRELFFGKNESKEDGLERMKRLYCKTLGWKVSEEEKLVIGLPENELKPTHPIFPLRHSILKDTLDYFYNQ